MVGRAASAATPTAGRGSIRSCKAGVHVARRQGCRQAAVTFRQKRQAGCVVRVANDLSAGRCNPPSPWVSPAMLAEMDDGCGHALIFWWQAR